MKPEQAARALAKFGSFLLLVLLILRGLSLAETMQIPASPLSNEAEPVTGQFSISEDGKQVFFWESLDPPTAVDRFKVTPAWFRMSIEGGPIIPIEKPEVDIRPFVLRDEQLFILVGDGVSLSTGSLPGTRVGTVALSPNRDEIAFSAKQDLGPGGLYVLNSMGQLNWLGEEDNISGISWSPDSQQIAYVSKREGIDQIFTIDRFGRNLLQRSKDEGAKRNPIWLADSQSIVFIKQDVSGNGNSNSSPTTFNITYISLIDSKPELLVNGLSTISYLGVYSGHKQIAFTQPGPKRTRSQQLFGLDPKTRSVRRIYPPLSIDSFHCPEQIPQSSEISIQFELTNTSQLPASVPVILRGKNEPLQVLGERDEGALRIEAVDLNPGETKLVEWKVAPITGLRTHFSIIINQGEVFPMAEEHCMVVNTYLGLPKITYLPLTIPLIVTGTILILPWLRHRKRRWLWALLAAYPVMIGLLILVEIILVRAGEG